MKHKKLVAAIAFLLFSVSLLTSFLLLRPANTASVEIVQNGVVLYRLNLSECEDQEICLTYDGRKNTILICKGEIWVEEADCPDHICIQMGRLKSKALPIVCLPNRLVIQFADNQGVDAVVQ